MDHCDRLAADPETSSLSPGEIDTMIQAIVDSPPEHGAALDAAGSHLQALFDHAQDAFLLVDDQGRYIDANAAACALTGYARSELLRLSIADLTPTADREKVPALWQAFIRAEPSRGEYTILRKDGECVPVEYHAIARIMPGVHFSVLRDISARRQAHLFDQVRAGRERLQELSRRLVAAQELERRQIARDLHDQIGQNLAVLNINLSIARDQLSHETIERVDARLAKAIQIVDETVEQIRDVMAELRPPILDDCGLVAALRWYVRHFARHTDLAVLLDIEEPRSAPRLPPDLETALFRIAQEALTNVVKHARATLATLSLTMLDQTIRLTVSDDGVGFDAGATRQPRRRFSLGLMTMQERVEAFGGRLLIDSAPGQGTRITAEVVR
jgi:PAS domain S-box-containing protein